MKNPLSRVAVAIATAAAALSVVSCAYDPYYDGGGYSSYGGGYSSGYGYGGGSTSIFVSTGNARWDYDPYRYCYYDYTRRAYYDPYLYGYYPVGFLPPRVYGMPHPYGWRPGNGYCPPPRVIRGNYLSNYQNRYDLYRSRNFAWSNNIRRGDNGGRFDPNRYQANRPGPGRPDFNQNRPGQVRPGGFGVNRPGFGVNNPRPQVTRPQFGNPGGNLGRPQFQPGVVNRPQYGGNQPRPQFGSAPTRPQFQPGVRPQFNNPQTRPQFQPQGRPQFQPQGRPQFQPQGRPQFQPQGRPQVRPPAQQRQTRENNTLINSGSSSGQSRGRFDRGNR